MTRLSKEKTQKIKEEILSIIYHNSPKAMFTNSIAQELIRDEEFTKRLLLELKREGLVNEIKKSKEGYEYCKWRRWKLSQKTQEAYKNLIE